MHQFPHEFADLLNDRGRAILATPPKLEVFRKRGVTPIALLDGLIDDDVARDCMRLLDGAMYSRLRRMHTAIPREALTEMTEAYRELLPKTVRVKTVTLNSGRSLALAAAEEVGLAQMMFSDSFHDFAEALIGARLNREQEGRQIICYEPGDYSGPHNDHHPHIEDERNGFVDLHIMFSNDAVASQLLVYEERGYLSRAHDVTGTSAVAIYRLPFWHYTTPLVARPGREAEARRWLLLGTFAFDPPLRKLAY
ncbi:MAG: hypothetical protein QOH21_405 [Acidobacteriota bacterium]|jgi:hypothetical protein|nr:hypothetical protein [Acidobacteriota bacterium]